MSISLYKDMTVEEKEVAILALREQYDHYKGLVEYLMENKESLLSGELHMVSIPDEYKQDIARYSDISEDKPHPYDAINLQYVLQQVISNCIDALEKGKYAVLQQFNIHRYLHTHLHNEVRRILPTARIRIATIKILADAFLSISWATSKNQEEPSQDAAAAPSAGAAAEEEAAPLPDSTSDQNA